MSDEFASLKISIDASLKDFSSKMGDFEKILKGTEEQTKKTGGGFGEMAAGMLTAEAAMAAFKKSIDLIKDAVMGFDDDLMTTLRLTKEFGKEGTAQFEKYAETAIKGTRFSSDEIKLAGQKLTINKLNREEIQKLLPVIMDYATKSGRDAVSTAEAFGRAVQYGTTRGLRPFGIEVDKSGSQLEIFNEILKSGTLPSVQNLAKEAGALGAGGLIEMQHQIEEMKDSLGEKLLPVFQEVVTWLKDEAVPVAENLIENFGDVAANVKLIGEALLLYFSGAKLVALITSIEKLTTATSGLNVALLANPIALTLGVAAVAALGVKAANDELDAIAKNYDKRAGETGVYSETGEGNVASTKPTGRGIQYKEDIKLLKETTKALVDVADKEASYTDTSAKGYIDAHEKAEALRKTLASLNVEYDGINKKIKIMGEELAVSDETGLILGKEKEFAQMEEQLPSTPLSAAADKTKLSDKRKKDTAEKNKEEAAAWKNFKELAEAGLKTYEQTIDFGLKNVDVAFAEHRKTIDEWYTESEAQLIKGHKEEIRVLTELKAKSKDVTEQKKYDQQIIQADLKFKKEELELIEEKNKKLREQARAEAEIKKILADSAARSAKSKSGKEGDPFKDLADEHTANLSAIDSFYEDKIALVNKYETDVNKRKEILGKLALNKKKELDDEALAYDKRVHDKKIQLASNAAGQLADTFQNLYELTGKKSEAMFALWKASAIAKTVIDTYSSATASYNALADIPVVGPVLGGIAAAAAITAGLLNVKKIMDTKIDKAAIGGYINGRSHAAGGTIIEAEDGEFIQRKSAVSKYGLRAMEAINAGLIPVSALSSYTSNVTPRAESGGPVSSSATPENQPMSIVNFFDMTAFKQFLNSEEGSRAMVNHVSQNSFKYKKVLAIA